MSEQQIQEREQRAQEREERQRAREHEIQESEARMKHELDLRKLEIEVAVASHKASKSGEVMSKGSKMPKLPPFVDDKDEIDSYLQRFERFVKNSIWVKSE